MKPQLLVVGVAGVIVSVAWLLLCGTGAEGPAQSASQGGGVGTRSEGIARVELPPATPPRREPSYAPDVPRYCQLAFGQGASERVWLVRAGRTLYADLDRDGDLTDQGESFEAAKIAAEQVVHADIPVETPAGLSRLTHEGSPATSNLLLAAADGRRWGAWGDERGPLRFAATPGDAPIIHFEGPLQLGFETRGAVLRELDGRCRVSAGVGCYGRGPGSFAHLKENCVPGGATPEARVSFGERETSSAPRYVTMRLRQRC